MPTASVSSSASSSPPLAAPRLSIVVLPFTNLSDDRAGLRKAGVPEE
jgi:TolB-like protein